MYGKDSHTNGGIYIMEKKNIDWGNIGFGYIPTDIVLFLNSKTANGMRVN